MKKHRSVYYVLTVLYIFSFLACAGTPQNQQPSTVSQSKVVPGVQKVLLSSVENMPLNEPLPGRYDNIIIRKFTSDTQTKENYPRATYDCQASIIWQLKEKNAYANVTDVNTKYPGKSVYVDMEIVDIRITSTTARIWGVHLREVPLWMFWLKFQILKTKKLFIKKCFQHRIMPWQPPGVQGPVTKACPLILVY